MEAVERLSGKCGEFIRTVWAGCLGCGRLSGWFQETVWMVWEGGLVGVGEALWRLSGGCVEVV